MQFKQWGSSETGAGKAGSGGSSGRGVVGQAVGEHWEIGSRGQAV